MIVRSVLNVKDVWLVLRKKPCLYLYRILLCAVRVIGCLLGPATLVTNNSGRFTT